MFSCRDYMFFWCMNSLPWGKAKSISNLIFLVTVWCKVETADTAIWWGTCEVPSCTLQELHPWPMKFFILQEPVQWQTITIHSPTFANYTSLWHFQLEWISYDIPFYKKVEAKMTLQQGFNNVIWCWCWFVFIPWHHGSMATAKKIFLPRPNFRSKT